MAEDGGEWKFHNIRLKPQKATLTSIQLLYASSYGVPASRCRLVVLAAAPFEKLPFFPRPTHQLHPRLEASSVSHPKTSSCPGERIHSH